MMAVRSASSERPRNHYFQVRFGLLLTVGVDVLRSYAAIQQLQPGDCYATGPYNDQSHGICDVKKYTGATLSQLYLYRQHQGRYIRL
jgi:hypothetical protein